jgi:group I intron endonuclease
MVIYKITNLINGKLYIGQTTTTIEKRFKQHIYKYSTNSKYKTIINQAIKKYGKENFQIEIIDVGADINELNLKEKKWIVELNTIMPHGYNMTTGGDRYVMSEETKEKLRKSSTGKKVSDETRKKQSKSHMGHVVKEETKEKIRRFYKGKKQSKDLVEKRIAAMGKIYTMIDPNGNVVRFKNLSKFCLINGLSKSKMCLVNQGKRNHHKNWKKYNE